MITKREAIKVVQACANSVIEQRERQAKGWDKGLYRDNDTFRTMTIEEGVDLDVAEAFRLSADFAGK